MPLSLDCVCVPVTLRVRRREGHCSTRLGHLCKTTRRANMDCVFSPLRLHLSRSSKASRDSVPRGVLCVNRIAGPASYYPRHQHCIKDAVWFRLTRLEHDPIGVHHRCLRSSLGHGEASPIGNTGRVLLLRLCLPDRRLGASQCESYVVCVRGARARVRVQGGVAVVSDAIPMGRAKRTRPLFRASRSILGSQRIVCQ